MKPLSVFCIVFLALAFVASAQEQKSNLMVFASKIEDRGETRVLYWDSAKDAAAGQVVIHHGRPIWRPEYDDPKNFDAMTKGKTWRLGKDFWTTLATDMTLKMAGKEIAPGAYYLGAERSADGASWSLVFYETDKVRASRIDASQIEKATAAFKVPLTFKTVTEAKESLSIALTNTKEKPQEISLTIAWGKFELATEVRVTL